MLPFLKLSNVYHNSFLLIFNGRFETSRCIKRTYADAMYYQGLEEKKINFHHTSQLINLDFEKPMLV